MNFVSLDFETATPKRNTPCEIGITVVENSKIIETRSWLIKPQVEKFHFMNERIHKISIDMVADQPEFDKLWPELEPYIINKTLVAHNAAFDMSVLRNTLDLYGIEYPEVQYLCSYLMAKNLWVMPSYDLKSCCFFKKIAFEGHHRAANDSKAAAELLLFAAEEFQIDSFKRLVQKAQLELGKLYTGGYSTSRSYGYGYSATTYAKNEVSKAGITKDPESIFYNKKVLFTGTLASMSRATAHDIIQKIGGIPTERITTTTDILVVGHQDFRIVGEDGMSNKQEHAMKLIEKGSKIEMMSESDFLKHIEYGEQ